MQVKFTRAPFLSDNPTETLVGFARVDGDDEHRYIHIQFVTNPDRERRSAFWTGLGPRNFTELARLMMKANAPAAIRAFGVALQEYSPKL